MILSSYPTIDLHGCDRDYAVYLVKEFHVDVINTGCTVVDLDLN